MSQSLSQIYLHIIFSTKNRHQSLTEDIQAQLFPYMATILREHGSAAYKVGGYLDHIHIACTLPKTKSPVDLISEVKISSTKWLKHTFEGMEDFGWQHGYGVFSFSQSHLESVVEYIVNQKAHHHKLSFKDEMVAFLEKYNVEYNEKYLWD